MVPVYCITLDPKGKRALRTVEEFRPHGVAPTLVRGIDANKWGLKTSIELHHNDGVPYFIAPPCIGNSISHWMLWNYLLVSSVPEALIVEDDVKLCFGFREEFQLSFAELPADWEFAFVGHCCAADKHSAQITPRIWDIRWPMCTHCYLVRLSAIEKLLEHCGEARTKVDSMLIENVFAKGLVKPYTFQPRQAEQYETFLRF